jgi:uracil-DNA glycosylase
MLNAILTVEEGKPGSHKMIGWQTFTDGVIQLLSSQKKGLVFLLWGAFARSKKSLIDTSKHRVLEAAHPSPLARGAFFGSQHFSKTNTILTSQGQEPIDWQII